jgi:hypothetical protein
MKEKRAGAVLGAAGGLIQGELLVRCCQALVLLNQRPLMLLVSGRRRFLNLKMTNLFKKLRNFVRHMYYAGENPLASLLLKIIS